MKKLLNNKLFFILLFFIFTIFLNINISSAHIEKYDIINKKFGSYGWVLYKATDNNIYVAVSERADAYGYKANYDNAYAQIDSKSKNGIRFGRDTSINHYVTTVVYQVDNDYNFVEKCSYIWQNNDYKPYTDISEIIDVHLKRDITDSSTKSVVFSYTDYDGEIADPFLPPLLGIKETLVVETEKAQIMEQIKTMIVGFLKYLIALVISVIAFYKGWKFLSMQLRKS